MGGISHLAAFIQTIGRSLGADAMAVCAIVDAVLHIHDVTSMGWKPTQA
jgi:hypothetical protein